MLESVEGTSTERTPNAADGSRRGFFFFQAEDGIRDVAVTGVQTCALPILSATVLSGSVTNARGLSSAGHGDATLTVTAASAPATVLLDYGVEVEGTPYLDRKSVV